MSAPLNDEIALRVGLAANELEGVETRDLLEVMIKVMGEPITHAKIEKLRARKLKMAAGELFVRVERSSFERAFALLKGRGINRILNPAPNIDEGVFCEISGSLRVACASNSGEYIDGAFSNCMRYLIYQVSPDYIRLIDIREPSKKSEDKDLRNQLRANLLSDCSLLYTTSIGAPAAAKAVKVGLHPITINSICGAEMHLSRLQEVLSQHNPPPWLVKAMGKPSLGVKLYGENLL